ncbi:MAG: hypothetical protein M3441_01020 [Chloroflexota bacterium]|nr:hypothetical protein [Chloroflexota bacterium]
MNTYEWGRFDLESQDYYMRFWYPSMERLPSAPDEAVWRGHLRAGPESPPFTVCIWYRLGHEPIVWVREVLLAKRKPPHIWLPDDSLCLYRREERPWRTTDVIAYTIVPWTISWLGFYELWIDTDRWLGPEAPHTPKESWHDILRAGAKEKT